MIVDLKIGQVWDDKDNEVRNIITNLFSQTDYSGYEEPFCQGIDSNGVTFSCMTRQFQDEVECRGIKLLSTYDTWQEAINSKEFRI